MIVGAALLRSAYLPVQVWSVRRVPVGDEPQAEVNPRSRAERVAHRRPDRDAAHEAEGRPQMVLLPADSIGRRFYNTRQEDGESRTRMNSDEAYTLLPRTAITRLRSLKQ